MGLLTHDQLITEALELAGNTSLTARGQTWLGLVLRRLTGQFQFPQQQSVVGSFTPTFNALHSDAVGGDEVAAGAPGVSTLNGTVVRGIEKVILRITSNGGVREKELRVIHEQRQREGDVSYSSPGSAVGEPDRVIVTPYVDGFYVRTFPYPSPSSGQTFSCLVFTTMLWNGMSYVQNTINPYMDDWTVIQGIYAFALRHQQDERAGLEMDAFLAMAREDRVRYGNLSRANSTVQLSGPHKINPMTNKSRGPGWMGPV